MSPPPFMAMARKAALPHLCKAPACPWGALLLAFASRLQVHAQLPGAAPEPQPLPHPDLPEPPPIPEGIALWVWIVSGLLALALLTLILWLLLRSRPLKPAAPANPRLHTLRALRQLAASAPTLPPPETGHRVSRLLRQYLHDRYRIPAPYRTTPELFATSNSVPSEPAPTSDGLFEIRPARHAIPSAPAVFAPLAEFWDRLAFAPLPATTTEALELVETAIKRVEEDPA